MSTYTWVYLHFYEWLYYVYQRYTYKYMSTYTYFIIRILIRVLKLFLISLVDYYMNTIGDMQNELNFFTHYNEIEYNHSFEIFFSKIDDALLEFVVLAKNV